MTDIEIIAMFLTTIWIGLVYAIRLMKPRRHQVAIWLAVFLGVPLLGLITLIWGPVIGGVAFLIGASLLFFGGFNRPMSG